MPIQAAVPHGTRRLYRPRRKTWTRREYERLVDMGILTPDDRVELLEGEIVQKTPHKTPHATGICLSEEAIRRVLPPGYVVRTQLPVALGDLSEPEPDIAVIEGSVRDYEAAHPSTAALLIEVSDTTLRVDCTTKAGLYARAGIADYWVLDLNDRRLIVHRQPVPMPDRPLGFSYASVTYYAEGEQVIPLAAGDVAIPVADLLPRAKR
jgi:Uma2 family endonuclease